MRNLAKLALLLALLVFETQRGFLPAWSKIDTDFPNYLTSAKIVAHGGDTGRLYDDVWFRGQMRDYGMEGLSTFTPFPPPTALVMLPLAGLQPLTALRVMSLLSVLCLIAATIVLARCVGCQTVDSAIFILLSGNAIMSCLRFGQVYIVVSMLCILGYHAYRRDKPWVAGLCFGLFGPIKYFPLVFPAYLAMRRHWKVAAGAGAAVCAIALVSVVVLGWSIHWTFLTRVLGNHLTAHIGVQDPFATAFQSFDTLYRQLFVFDPVLNPHPAWVCAPAQLIAMALTKGFILVAAGLALIRLRGEDPAPSLGILGILILLIAPATATYHYALLWLPVGLLVGYWYRQGARAHAYLLLAAYAVIGFCPYRQAYAFAGRGALTVLAYPRLFLVASMFFVGVHAALTRFKLLAVNERGDTPPSNPPGGRIDGAQISSIPRQVRHG